MPDWGGHVKQKKSSIGGHSLAQVTRLPYVSPEDPAVVCPYPAGSDQTLCRVNSPA